MAFFLGKTGAGGGIRILMEQNVPLDFESRASEITEDAKYLLTKFFLKKETFFTRNSYI